MVGVGSATSRMRSARAGGGGRRRERGVRARRLPGPGGARRRDRRLARGVRRRFLVVLAGYMQLLDPAFLARFESRVVNVHGRCCPRSCAGGRAGARLRQRPRGRRHFVDEGVDTGRIIAQRARPARGQPASMADALRLLEHDLLCEAVALIGRGP